MVKNNNIPSVILRAGFLLLLVLCLLLREAVANDECVYAGDGVSRVHKQIDVKAHNKTADNYADLWVESGLSVVAGQKIEVGLSGNVNLCNSLIENVADSYCEGSVTGKVCHASHVEVHSVLCSDFSKPTYPTTDPYNDFNASTACSATGAFSNTTRYTNTGVKVNTGDHVKFSLIPTKIKLNDCDAAPSGVILDYNNIYVAPTNSAISITGSAICKREQEVKNRVGGGAIKIGGYEGNTYDVLVTNNPSPIGNKWTSDRSNSGYPISKWISGSNVDLRTFTTVDLTSLNRRTCSPYSTPISGGPCYSSSMNTQYLHYDSYTLNNLCARMYHVSGNWNQGVKSFYQDESMKSVGGSSDQICSVDLDSDEVPIQRAAGLIAQIGGSKNALLFDGKQLIPNGDASAVISGRSPANADSVSLRLDYPYEVGNDIALEEISLAIASSSYANNAGGYHIKTERLCILENGKGLYVYIGKSAPTERPDIVGTPISQFKNAIDDQYTIKGSSGNEGDIYFAIHDPDADAGEAQIKWAYRDNSGEYKLTLDTDAWKPIISDIMKTIMEPVKRWIGGEYDSNGVMIKKGFARKSFDRIVADTSFGKMVQVLMALYIAIYAMLFSVGIVQVTHHQLVIMIVKIGILMQLINPSSWDFFESHFLAIFTQGLNDLLNTFSTYLDADSDFAFLDSTFGIFLVTPTWKLIVSLLFAGPIGWVMFALILWGVLQYFAAMFTFIMLYFMSLMGSALLISIAPLFIACILFKQTMKLFQNWLKQLISFSVQPLILFIALAFINQIMRVVLYNLFNFSACSDCLFRLNLGGSFNSFCFIKFFLPMGFGGHSVDDRLDFEDGDMSEGDAFLGLPVTIVGGITFVIMVHVMKKFVDIIQDMVMSIFGFLPGSMSIPGAAQNATQQASALVGMDRASKARRQDSRSMFERYHASREKSQKRADVDLKDSGNDAAGRGGGGKNAARGNTINAHAGNDGNGAGRSDGGGGSDGGGRGDGGRGDGGGRGDDNGGASRGGGDFPTSRDERDPE